MKYSNFSFLFFYALYGVIFFIGTEICFAQESIDSLDYYYSAILKPKKPTDLPNGIRYYTKQKENDIFQGDTLSAIQRLRMIAIGQMKIGNSYDSENSIVEALGLIDQLENKHTLTDDRSGLYNQLGRIYRNLNDHQAALKSFDVALQISKKTKDSITILNNIANVYKDLEAFEQANQQYQLVYQKSLESGDSLQLAMALDNLGLVQSKIGLPEAFINLIKGLEIRKAKNDLTGMYTSYKSLANYYLDKGDNVNAKMYANNGYDVAKKINSSSYLQDALSVYMKVNDNPKAKEYMRLNDSISNAKQLASNKNAFIKYNLDEERKMVAQSKLEQEKEKGMKLLYQAITVFVVLLLIASFFMFRYRNKKGKIEEAYKTETRISKKVHDEVANDVYHVMTKLQINPNNNEEILDDLDKIYAKTRDISKENSTIDVGDNFGETLNDLLLSYKSQNVNIITKNLSKINWNSISTIRKTTIYRVLQELMTNMRKHSEASLVALNFNRTGSKIHIDYKDNGVGCAMKKNNGLQNAENRIKSINGTISFESEINEGFQSKITV